MLNVFQLQHSVTLEHLCYCYTIKSRAKIRHIPDRCNPPPPEPKLQYCQLSCWCTHSRLCEAKETWGEKVKIRWFVGMRKWNKGKSLVSEVICLTSSVQVSCNFVKSFSPKVSKSVCGVLKNIISLRFSVFGCTENHHPVILIFNPACSDSVYVPNTL